MDTVFELWEGDQDRERFVDRFSSRDLAVKERVRLEKLRPNARIVIVKAQIPSTPEEQQRIEDRKQSMRLRWEKEAPEKANRLIEQAERWIAFSKKKGHTSCDIINMITSYCYDNDPHDGLKYEARIVYYHFVDLDYDVKISWRHITDEINGHWYMWAKWGDS